MTSLGATLKNEITRLSRKELRAQVEPLRKANANYRRDIAALKRDVVTLQRQVASTNRASSRVSKPGVEVKSTRFVAKGLRSLRTRLDLSANDFGKLAGASGQSIYNWESGKAVPRKAQMSVLADLRTLGKREAHERLARITDKAPKVRKIKSTR